MKTIRQKTLEQRIDKLKQENSRLKEKLDRLRHDKQSITKALKDARKLLNEIPVPSSWFRMKGSSFQMNTPGGNWDILKRKS